MPERGQHDQERRAQAKTHPAPEREGMSTHMLDRATPVAHPSPAAPRMLRVAEVARRLDLPEKRLYILAREGIIPHVRLGRSVRFNEAEIEAWIAAGGAGYPGAEE